MFCSHLSEVDRTHFTSHPQRHLSALVLVYSLRNHKLLYRWEPFSHSDKVRGVECAQIITSVFKFTRVYKSMGSSREVFFLWLQISSGVYTASRQSLQVLAAQILNKCRLIYMCTQIVNIPVIQNELGTDSNDNLSLYFQTSRYREKKHIWFCFAVDVHVCASSLVLSCEEYSFPDR